MTETVTQRPRSRSKTARSRLIAAIHSAAKKQGMDEDTRRDLMERIAGKRSAAEMTPQELGKVLDELNRDTAGRGTLGFGWRRKIKALWISAHQLGLTERGDDRALDAFVQRQTGVSVLRFVPAEKASAVVEALKDWLAREGGVDWTWPQGADDRQCIALAMWRRLRRAGAVIDDDFACEHYCRKALGIAQVRSLTGEEWGRALPILAEKLHKTEGGDDGPQA